MKTEYKYLSYFMLCLIPIAYLGFKETYFLHFPNNFPDYLDGLVHTHFTFVSLWILMLIVQPYLIRKRNLSLHRKIGKLSYLVFSLLIISSVLLIIRRYREDGVLMSSYFAIADCTLLITFYTLAIYYKNKVSYHMRFMIGTAFIFLGPTLGRIGPILLGFSSFLTQHILYGIIYSILGMLIYTDRKHKRDYRPYLIIFAGFILHQIGFYFK